MNLNSDWDEERYKIFNSGGLMLETLGYSTIATGKPMSCPFCDLPTLFLHQYAKYKELRCCGTCYNFQKNMYDLHMAK